MKANAKRLGEDRRLRGRARWLLLLWAALGALVFLGVYGPLPLDVTYDKWLLNGYVEHDATQHYAGWLAFRHSPWLFPLGKMEGLGGAVATYTDSIPVFAILFKALDPLLPETFQYFGLYMLLCFMLQAVAAGLLLRLYRRELWVSVCGVLLFCLAPVMLERAFRHTALASHWLILFMIWFLLRARREEKLSPWSGLLPLLCIGIHPYYLPVLFGLQFIAVVETALRKPRSLGRGLAILLLSVGATAGFGYLIGALGTTTSLGGPGFGHYSMNLNAVVNPLSCSGIVWSRFLPVLPQILGNYDGFNYWGLGVFALTALGLVLGLTRLKQLGGFLKRNWLLLLFALGCFVFALSNVVTCNDQILLEYGLPARVLKLCSVFRASSRMFYVVFYLVLLWGLSRLCLLRRPALRGILITAVLALQLLDLSPALETKFESFRRESIEETYASADITGSALWNELAARGGKLKLLNKIWDYKLAAFAEKNGMAPDINVSSSHFNGGVDLEALWAQYRAELRDGRPDPNAYYISSDEALARELAEACPGVRLVQADKYWLIVPEALPLTAEPLP